jgi:hypothetical protein
MDTILVANAGSSSVKFQVFGIEQDGSLKRQIKGQMDGIGSRPRLRVNGADGTVLVDRTYDARQLPAIAVMLFGLSVMLPVKALAIELTGAWSTDAKLCNLVFTKKGKQVEFAELSDLYGSGLVINGDRIRGKAARCTIKSRKQEGDVLDMSAACASTIITGNLRFSLRVIDDNNFSRMFPDIEGMEIKYTRCSF